MILREWKVNLFAVFFLVVSASIFVQFLKYHEAQILIHGWHFSDPAFSILPVKDVSVFIFMLTYGSIITYTLLFYKKSLALARLMIAYGLLVLLRILSMTIVPLKEPDTLVFLNDPFLNNLVYPGQVVSDLFFSGHTALVIVMYFLSGRKLVFLFFAIMLGFLLMIQRVHYSIDILGALPFAYLAFAVTNRSLDRWQVRNKV